MAISQSKHSANMRISRKCIGKNIQRLRLSRGMTLHRFSRVTHISVRNLDLYEMGRGMVTLEAMQNIMMCCRVSNEYFFEGVVGVTSDAPDSQPCQ
jgi:transcriptional regulator with XRE-family HTH domain